MNLCDPSHQKSKPTSCRQLHVSLFIILSHLHCKNTFHVTNKLEQILLSFLCGLKRCVYTSVDVHRPTSADKSWHCFNSRNDVRRCRPMPNGDSMKERTLKLVRSYKETNLHTKHDL